ncbi:hypothetical protein BFP70_05000 [Thioclava sp. SK-1]|uniref:hypothetical protein n=1 Tax=Thioclava sp. SK-1 TaxID=1889770 RepID=UPI000825AA07|nr:hypothetical protein [Thioclava sp. SK-1]OCX66385.1 hypothetical protein BFP70_05000 [Thioclava sp. SK-1]
MKLTFHIGMGKTGSSAIQAALRANADRLRAQGADYLGMWFDMIDPNFSGVEKQSNFFALSPPDMIAATDHLIGVLRARNDQNGTDHFILSNEAFSGNAKTMRPMISQLVAAGITVQLIGYARDPASWLPSAHVQWSIRDKVSPGPVQAYNDRARELVQWYSGLINWHQMAGDLLDVRSYDAADDIAEDFATAIGVTLDVPQKRVLERGEDFEILLRAAFNTRFPDHVLPRAFDQAIFRSASDIPSLEQLAEQCFNYDQTAQIVAQASPLFEEFKSCFGFDPRDAGKTPPKQPDMEHLRRRILDYLVETNIRQARRLLKLERQMADTEAQMQHLAQRLDAAGL